MKSTVLVCTTLVLFGLLSMAHASERGLGPWTLNPLPEPFPLHRGFATCTNGDVVYMLGGDSTGAATGHMDYVGFALVQPDRTLGAWTGTESLPHPVWMPEVVRYGNHVYQIGGYSNGGTADAYMAEIQADNTLGLWTATSSLPSAVYGHTSALDGNRIYVLGNWRDNAVYYAEIQTAGDLGPWQTTTPLPEDLYAGDAAVFNGKLFVFGGKEIVGSVQTVVPHVRYAEIQPDGSLGSWIMTDAMPAERWFHQVEIYEDRVFVVGGSTSASATDDVAEGQIMTDGSIAWTVESYLPIPSSGNGLAQINGYLYYIAGQWIDEIYYAEIQVSSAVDPLTPGWYQLDVWPNPCPRALQGSFSLAQRERVRITVCDTQGREIALLTDRDMAPGNHVLHWNGRDRSGARVPNGVYLVKLEASSLAGSQRVMLVR